MSDDIKALQAELAKERESSKALQEQLEKLKKENEHLVGANKQKENQKL